MKVGCQMKLMRWIWVVMLKGEDRTFPDQIGLVLEARSRIPTTSERVRGIW
jgi:hypothetical protein